MKFVDEARITVKTAMEDMDNKSFYNQEKILLPKGGPDGGDGGMAAMFIFQLPINLTRF